MLDDLIALASCEAAVRDIGCPRVCWQSNDRIGTSQTSCLIHKRGLHRGERHPNEMGKSLPSSLAQPD